MYSDCDAWVGDFDLCEGFLKPESKPPALFPAIQSISEPKACSDRLCGIGRDENGSRVIIFDNFFPVEIAFDPSGTVSFRVIEDKGVDYCLVFQMESMSSVVVLGAVAGAMAVRFCSS